MTTVPGINARREPVPAVTRAVGARYHAVTVWLSVWMIVGVFIDGWSHGQTTTETFFSPWHAVVYSGFLAVTYWIAGPIVRSRETPRLRVPAGYAPGLIGIAMIATGAVADSLWHAAFGFEQGTEVLMSPPHFLLVAGMALVVSSPFRAAWASGDSETPTLRAFLTPLISLVLAVSVLMLIFFPLWGLGNGRIITPGSIERLLGEFAPGGAGRPRVLEAAQHWAIGNVLITTWALMAPVFLMIKRWRPPFGAVTFLFFCTSFLMASLTGFLYRSVLLPPLLAGLAADAAIAFWWPLAAHPVRLRAFAAFVPAALWGFHFLATQMQWGLAWGPAMWLGVMCWAAASGVGLSLLVFPSVGGDRAG